LLAVAGAPLRFVDEDRYRIKPGDLEIVHLPLRKNPAVVNVSYAVQAGSDKVRVLLVGQDDFYQAQSDLARLPDEAVLASTPRGKSGSFEQRVARKGDYVIVLDNRAGRENGAVVQMRVAFDYPKVTQLSPERQFTVIAISFLSFFAVVTYSARKLLKATRG
jgi:hypothetical protein